MGAFERLGSSTQTSHERKFEQLALLLSRTYPSVGDQLLGVIELVRSESEQARSLALCEAVQLC